MNSTSSIYSKLWVLLWVYRQTHGVDYKQGCAECLEYTVSKVNVWPRWDASNKRIRVNRSLTGRMWRYLFVQPFIHLFNQYNMSAWWELSFRHRKWKKVNYVQICTRCKFFLQLIHYSIKRKKDLHIIYCNMRILQYGWYKIGMMAISIFIYM